MSETKRTRIVPARNFSVPVMRGRVLGVDVIRGFAKLCDLATISRADIYDSKWNPTGTQRDLSPKHAKDAYEYINREELAFWPEVFLNLRNKNALLIQTIDPKTGYSRATFDLNVIKDSRGICISRVDGNHRLHFADGKSEGYPAIEKIVSFCLAIDLDLKQEMKLFRDINDNQRRMNTSHLENIKLQLDSEQAIAARDPMLYIANKLKEDRDSPLYGIVFDGGKSDVTKFIPLKALKTGLEYMFSRPTRLTALENIKIQTQVIKHYFHALKRWQPDAWKYPKDYLLLRGAGLWGGCFLGAEVIDRALAQGHYKWEEMLKILQSGTDWDWTRDGPFKGFSGRNGALRIRDMIAAEFSDSQGVSLKTLIRQISEDM